MLNTATVATPDRTRATSFHPLWELAHQLRSHHRWVDLTHSFHPGQPRFAALPDEEVHTVFTVADAGFYVQSYQLVGQWGTHVDPPVHFVPHARTLDNIPVSESLLPLAVVDVHHEVEHNPDFVATPATLLAWEERNGRIPNGSFVALRTDWSRRWSTNSLNGFDDAGRRHSPGWSIAALEFLAHERGVVAIGHETTDTDPGQAIDAGDLRAERYWLEQDRWQIELLTGLDQVPETGAIISATWPKPREGSGFPARVFAILPEEEPAA